MRPRWVDGRVVARHLEMRIVCSTGQDRCPDDGWLTVATVTMVVTTTVTTTAGAITVAVVASTAAATATTCVHVHAPHAMLRVTSHCICHALGVVMRVIIATPLCPQQVSHVSPHASSHRNDGEVQRSTMCIIIAY